MCGHAVPPGAIVVMIIVHDCGLARVLRKNRWRHLRRIQRVAGRFLVMLTHSSRMAKHTHHGPYTSVVLQTHLNKHQTEPFAMPKDLSKAPPHHKSRRAQITGNVTYADPV